MINPHETRNHLFIKYFANIDNTVNKMHVAYLNIAQEKVFLNYPPQELDTPTDWFVADQYPTPADWIVAQLHYVRKYYKDYLREAKKPTLVEMFRNAHAKGDIVYQQNLPCP